MGYRNQQEQGAKLSRDARTGLGGFPPLKGMNKEGDPGSIPPNQFPQLENIRISAAGTLFNRGGQSKLNNDAMSGCIKGIFAPEFQFPYSAEGGVFLAPGSSSGELLVYGGPGLLSVLSAPSVLRDPADRLIEAYAYSGNILVGTGPQGAPVGTSPQVLSLNPQSLTYSVLTTISSPDTEVTDITSIGTTVYIATSLGTGTGRVLSWNGTSVTAEDTFSGNANGTVLGVHNNEPYVLYGGNTGLGFPAPALKRKTGGVWTSITLPAAVSTKFSANTMLTYGSNLYIDGFAGTGTDEGAYILVWNGTTCTVARGPLGGSSWSGTGLAVFNSNLYYGYAGGIDEARIGKYDGVTWTDVEKDLATQFGSDDLSAQVTPFASQGSLYAAVLGTDGSNDIAHIMRSPGTSTSGTWIKLSSISRTSGNPGIGSVVPALLGVSA